MATAEKVIIVFDRSHGVYNAGERAGFTPREAQHLIDHEIAHSAKKGRLFARGKKQTEPAQKLEPGTRVKFFIKGEGDAIGEVISAPKTGPVRVAHGDREVKVDREGLVFISPPESKESPEQEPKPDVIEVGARVEFKEGEHRDIGTVIEISGDAFSIETEEGAKHVVFREFVRLAEPPVDEGGGGDGSQNAGDGNPPPNA